MYASTLYLEAFGGGDELATALLAVIPTPTPTPRATAKIMARIDMRIQVFLGIPQMYDRGPFAKPCKNASSSNLSPQDIGTAVELIIRGAQSSTCCQMLAPCYNFEMRHRT